MTRPSTESGRRTSAAERLHRMADDIYDEGATLESREELHGFVDADLDAVRAEERERADRLEAALVAIRDCSPQSYDWLVEREVAWLAEHWYQNRARAALRVAKIEAESASPSVEALDALRLLMANLWRYSFEYSYPDGEVNAEEYASEVLARLSEDRP